jgi:hypothetical protein
VRPLPAVQVADRSRLDNLHIRKGQHQPEKHRRGAKIAGTIRLRLAMPLAPLPAACSA